MLKHKKFVLAALLAIAGGAFFTAYSSLESHFFVSAWVILTLQTVACLYLIYLYWSGQFKGKSSYQKQQQDDEF